MASKLTMFPRLNPKKEDESASHFFAREGQVILRFTVRLLVLITAIFMISLWLWVAIPVTFLLIAYGLLMLTNVAEERTRTPAPGSEEHGEMGDEIIAGEAGEVAKERYPQPTFEPPVDAGGGLLSLAVLKREVIIVAIAAVILGGIAGGVAIALFGWTLGPLALPVIFAYLVLLGWPVWTAALSADIESHAE